MQIMPASEMQDLVGEELGVSDPRDVLLNVHG